jgi:regulator of replication initiation timing
MARSAAVSTATELQPIDRLEEKIRQLVTMIDALRADRARALDEAARLERELGALRHRLGEASNASAEVAALREERDLIRTRVTQMISQIDKLNL